MSLKHSLWATGAWTLLGLLCSVLLITYITNNPIPGVRSETRAQMAGQGTGFVMLIGYALIWLPYALKVGKKRREAKQSQLDKKKKPPTE